MSPFPIGRFDHRSVARLPPVRLRGLAPSMARSPMVMAFDVDATSRSIAGVGAIVKADCFPDAPPFRCNVAFACGRGARVHRGGYADPWSPWFNVFYGAYQVDAPVSAWDRPFGFRAAGDGFVIDPHEVVRLGRADWDYLTAYPYGVPLDVIRGRRAEAPPAAAPEVDDSTLDALGRRWDLVRCDDVAVVSGYVSARDPAALATPHRVWSPLWRTCFGRPTARPDHPDSFPLVHMRTQFLVSWARDGEWFRTFVCGGAVSHHVADPTAGALLAAQLDAARSWVARAARPRVPQLRRRDAAPDR